MDSLPTGTMQSWIMVAALGLSPMVAFFVAEVIGRVLRRRGTDGDARRLIPGLVLWLFGPIGRWLGRKAGAQGGSDSVAR
jgi:hypothetical protein